MSLAKIGIRGAYFTSIALGLRQLISISTTFVVARQLAPSDVGTFTLVMVVIGMAQVIGDIGISTSLVRSQKNSTVLLSTCFWISGAIGMALLILIIISAPFAAAFYSKDEITPYLRISGIGILINFLLPVPMALMQQKLAYKELAIAQATGSLIGALATLALVFMNFGIWSLVSQPIIGNLFMLIALLIYSKWRPTFEFNINSAQDILISGAHLLGSGLVGYIRNTFDTIIIGKNLSSQDLGIYGMTQTILYAPMHLITSTVSRVVFPLLSKVKDDLIKLQATILTATSRTALLVFPLYSGLIILDEQFVQYVFGNTWIDMVPLIRIMSITFLIQSVTNVAGPLMLALNKTSIQLKMNFFSTIFYFAILLLLIPHGLTTIATGYAATNAIFALITLVVALHFANISLIKYLLAIFKPFLMTLFMSLLLILAKNSFGIDSFIWFLAYILSGAFIYLLLVLFFEKKAITEVIDAIRSK